MPLFGLGSKFSPRKATHRKSVHSMNTAELEQLVSEDGSINMKLGNNAFIFQQGNWLSNDSDVNGTLVINEKRTASILKNRMNELQEENYLLQIKLEILLNMLTETTSENHLQYREIEKLKSK